MPPPILYHLVSNWIVASLRSLILPSGELILRLLVLQRGRWGIEMRMTKRKKKEEEEEGRSRVGKEATPIRRGSGATRLLLSRVAALSLRSWSDSNRGEEFEASVEFHYICFLL